MTQRMDMVLDSKNQLANELKKAEAIIERQKTVCQVLTSDHGTLHLVPVP